MNLTRRGTILAAGAGVAAPALAAGAKAQTRKTWRDDAVWVEANGGSYHNYSRLLHSGAYGSAVIRIAQLSVALRPTPAARLDHALFYGDGRRDPEQFTGLGAVYDGGGPVSANVLDGGSRTGLRSSIWLIAWGERGIYMATPDGEPAPDGGAVAVVTQDWRWGVRIANLDPMVVLDTPEKGAALMAIALLRLPRVVRDHAAFYTSDLMGRALRGAMTEDASVLAANPGEFRSLPIRTVAALRDDEARV